MSRLSDVKVKYPSVDWERWKDADPSKNGKYLEWIGSNHNLIGLYGEETGNIASGVLKIKDALTTFETRKALFSHTEIKDYSFTLLIDEVAKLKPTRKEGKEIGVIEVGEVEGYKIIMLEGWEAVKAYCAGTKWCISKWETFLQYCEDNNVFIISKGKNKLCIIVGIAPNKNNSVSLNETIIYLKGDEEIYSVSDAIECGGAIYSLCKFIEIDIESSLNVFDKDCEKIKKVCEGFSKKNQNVFFKFYHFESNIEVIDKILKLEGNKEGFDIIINHMQSQEWCEIDTFFKLLVKNKHSLLPLIETHCKKKSTSISKKMFESLNKAIINQNTTPLKDKINKKIASSQVLSKLLDDVEVQKFLKKKLKIK